MSLLVRAGVERELVCRCRWLPPCFYDLLYVTRRPERNDAAEYCNLPNLVKPDTPRASDKVEKLTKLQYGITITIHNSYITALLKVAKAALILETHCSSCTRIRSKRVISMNPEQKQCLRKEQSAEMLTVDSVRTRRDSWRAMGPATGPWHEEGRPVRTRRGENDLPCSLSASATASISRESDSPAFSFSAMRRENTQLFIRATISSCLSLRPAAIYFFSSVLKPVAGVDPRI